MSTHSTSGQDATRHTPGPWTWDDRGRLISKAEPFYIIAEAGGKGVSPEGIAEVAANLRLIAAAPDLLAALKFVDRLYSTIGGVVNPLGYGLIANSDECGTMISAVRDAIAKAENGQ